MGFLPCPRFHRDGKPKEQRDSDGSAQSSDQAPSEDPNLDERALEIIFGDPSAMRDSLETTSAASATLETPKQRTTGRLSFSRLSHKLREKLSRESRLAKISLTNAEVSIENGFPSANGDPGSIVSPLKDLVASMTASDAGYDSDARNILTPQMVAQLATGASSQVSNQHEGVLSTIRDTRESTFPMGYDGAQEASNQSSMLSISPDDASTPRYPEQIPPFLKIAGTESGLAQTTVHQTIVDPDIRRFDIQTPTRKSKFAKDDDDYSSLKAIDCVVKQSWPPRQEESSEPLSRDVLPAADTTCLVNETKLPERIASLSIYSDDGPQGMERDPDCQPDASSLCVSNVYQAENQDQTQLAREEDEHPSRYQKFANMASRVIKSSPSLRLSIPRVRPLASDTRDDQEELSPQETLLTQSRFLENLEDVFVDQPESGFVGETLADEMKKENRKTSEGWLSGGKRHGYGYGFVPNSCCPGDPTQDGVAECEPSADISNGTAGCGSGMEREKMSGPSSRLLPAGKEPESLKRRNGLLPLLGAFMKSRRRHFSGSESALADVLLPGTQASGLDTPDAEDDQPYGYKIRQASGKWKRRSVSDNTGKRTSSFGKQRNRKRSGERQMKTSTETSVDKDSQALGLHPNPDKGFYLPSQAELCLTANHGATSDMPAPPLTDLNSAEAWSRIYGDCVDCPAAEDDLVSLSTGGSNCAQYARTIGNDSVEPSIHPEEEIIVPEPRMRDSLFRMVTDSWRR